MPVKPRAGTNIWSRLPQPSITFSTLEVAGKSLPFGGAHQPLFQEFVGDGPLPDQEIEIGKSGVAHGGLLL